jgi:DNA mismatch repair ATPase MutS
MAKSNAIMVTIKPQSFFESKNCIENCSGFAFKKSTVKGVKLLQAQSAGALLSYLCENFPTIDPNFMEPVEIDSNLNMKISQITLKALEINKTQMEGKRKGSLLHILDAMKTTGGSRLLASRICFFILISGAFEFSK